MQMFGRYIDNLFVKKENLGQREDTKSLRVADEVHVHLTCICSNEHILTNLVVKLSQHLKELWVIQIRRSL